MFRDQIAPLLITDLLPPMDGGSLDSPGVGVANDGRQYVLKVSSADNPLLPATEAFCASLATACQLPVAQGAWLIMENGTECYGSRLEGGVVKSIADAAIFRRTPLLNQALKRRWQRCDNRQVASGHYALDLFLYNFDRHLRNFLFQEMGSRLEILGIDYSRAWWTATEELKGSFSSFDLPSPLEMPNLDKRVERTVRVGRIIRKWIGFDQAAALRTLSILRQVPTPWIQNFCTQLPSNWMPATVANDLVFWWNSPSRVARITLVEEGLKNGSLL